MNKQLKETTWKILKIFIIKWNIQASGALIMHKLPNIQFLFNKKFLLHYKSVYVMLIAL